MRAYRVKGKAEATLDARVSSQKPFGLRTFVHGAETIKGLKDPIKLYGSQRVSWIERSGIEKNAEWIDEWKVLMTRVQGTSAAVETMFLSRPIVAGPGEACTESYVVAGRFASEKAAQSYAQYLRTRFVRFLVSLRKATQDAAKDVYAFVPDVPLDREWTDEKLYERYGLGPEEIAFIESTVKPMEAQPMSREFFPPRPASRPTVYAYEDTNPQYAGLLKVGYTTVDAQRPRRATVPDATSRQARRTGSCLNESAMRNDGTVFTDRDVHRMLRLNGVKNPEGEWFRVHGRADQRRHHRRTDGPTERGEPVAGFQDAAGAGSGRREDRRVFRELAQGKGQPGQAAALPVECQDALWQDLRRLSSWRREWDGAKCWS